MKLFKSRGKNYLYFLFRLISPVIDPIKFFQGIIGYGWFVKDLIEYKKKDPKSKLLSVNLFPILNDRVSFTPFDSHYFYQQLWVFENVLKEKPKLHVDIASTYELSGYLSKIVKTKFIDYRPIKTSLKNLEIERGNILNLKYKSGSIQSLSCLHVVEHIGLGRYGDPIDPEGSIKACKELQRVLAPKGFLYFSTPIGKERICFNAHRIHTSQSVVNLFNKLKLISFSVVDDNGVFRDKVRYEKYNTADYACGMFIFTKK